MKKKNYKTQFKLTAPRKTWRSILFHMDEYPNHCIHIDTELGNGVTCLWSYTGDEAGTHIKRWDMKTSGRLKSFQGGIIALQYGDRDAVEEDSVLSWTSTTHVPMDDAKEWIEDHLAQNICPTIFYDYNEECWKTSVCKPFSFSR